MPTFAAASSPAGPSSTNDSPSSSTAAAATVTVVVLDRPRHQKIIDGVRKVGAALNRRRKHRVQRADTFADTAASAASRIMA